MEISRLGRGFCSPHLDGGAALSGSSPGLAFALLPCAHLGNLEKSDSKQLPLHYRDPKGPQGVRKQPLSGHCRRFHLHVPGRPDFVPYSKNQDRRPRPPGRACLHPLGFSRDGAGPRSPLGIRGFSHPHLRYDLDHSNRLCDPFPALRAQGGDQHDYSDSQRAGRSFDRLRRRFFCHLPPYPYSPDAARDYGRVDHSRNHLRARV